jgi:hypothetical protein
MFAAKLRRDRDDLRALRWQPVAALLGWGATESVQVVTWLG